LSSVQTTLDEQLARYDAVIHLRTPPADRGYNKQNPLRTESASVAAEVDRRILQAWQSHPKRFVVESTSGFLDKAAETLDILRGEMPDCCKRHVVPAIHERLTR
jgi:nucleoside-diphosphate-sugar epimerase